MLVALLLGLVLNLIQVLFDYLNEDTALDTEIEAIITISHTPASQIAYNIDSRLAEELLEGLLKHSSIVQADIVDSDNRTLARKERKIAESPYRWMSDLLFEPTRSYTTRLAVHQLSDVDLGNLNVVVDTYDVGISFLKRAGVTLLSGFIKSLALSFLLLFVFYVMLTKPLLGVITSITEVAPDSPEKARLRVPQGHENDEIGTLVDSTNNHLHTIERSLLKIKQAEARLKTYSEQLEQIVEARTRELSDKNDQLLKSNRELVIAKEEAVKRAKARADFLANMSHEIRTPFNGVLGMISLTLEEPLSERQKSQLDVAYNSGVSLLQVLNDILDISKVEAGKLTLENISFDLRKTVDEVANLLVQNSAARNIKLYSYVQPDFPEHVFGDPTRIRQVISNLVGNAIKFTEEGHVLLSLTADTHFAYIRVEDTGIGISHDALDKIFSPFSQAYSDTTRKYGGTGLGLTLCKQLVQHMAGHLEVQSVVDQGSVFTVKLPLRADGNVKPLCISDSLRQFSCQLVFEEGNLSFRFIQDQLAHLGFTLSAISYKDKLSDEENSYLKTRLSHLGNETERPICYLVDDVHILSYLASDCSGILIQPSGSAVEDTSNRFKTLRTPINRTRLIESLQKLYGEEEEKPQAHYKDMLTPLTGRNFNILLVEDNRVNQMVAKTILTKLGFGVDIANNGQEAVESVQSKKYDAILMDCHMPLMDGYEATRKIRNELGMKTIPIIAVTANVMHGDKEKCFSAGMNDYVTKPYEKHILLDKLDQWLIHPES